MEKFRNAYDEGSMTISPLLDFEKDKGLTVIRLAVAILLGLHGIARLALGIVDDFGVFLGQTGFPLGVAWAWGVTMFELVGAVALILRKYVVPVAALFIVELITGIILVHGKEGWFVVGAGRNGVEYSVLLIACLAALIVSVWRERVAH